MREVRVPLHDVRIGEFVVRVGTREIGSRLQAVREVQEGAAMRGPRGGSYRLTAHGAAQYLVLVTLDGGTPLVKRTATVTVLRGGE